MFIVKNLSLNFGQCAIFDNISFTVNSNQRIGLVGRNGSGKTTLLKIIAGQQEYDSGQINIQGDKKVAYLPQNVILLSEKTIFREALNIYKIMLGNLGDLVEEYNSLEKKLDDSSVEDLERYSLLQINLQELEFEKKITEAKNILLGLGFREQQFTDPVQTLSVGWKMRLVLAKLLLQKADFYLFDEPTNHLDLVAKDWFLDFLKRSQTLNASSGFGFMLVCHDRYFLDKLCNQIYEVSLGHINIFTGNYSKYLEQKKHNQELLEKKFVEQQKFLKKERELIDRFRASATKAKMVQSRLKALDKIEMVKLEPKSQIMRFSLPKVVRTGKIVLTVKKLSKSFADKKIFKDISFEIERGEMVAIVAPNGQGKSTVLNIIMNKLKSNAGSFELGHNVKTAFFEQDQNKSLNLKNDLIKEVESACKTSEQRQRVRGLLGAFLFSGDDVDKRVSVLSGGEKNRVAMIKVLLQNANFLLLDEPTNHLDIESKDVLLNVLKKYDGTVLFVSHDRDFLNNLATSIIELKEDSAYKYKGNYDSFLVQKNAQKEVLQDAEIIESKAKDICHKTKLKENDYEKRKLIRRLETKISKQEVELELLTKKFESLEYGSKDYDQTLYILNKLEKELNKNLALWEELNF